jgi:hypothetical protein
MFFMLMGVVSSLEADFSVNEADDPPALQDELAWPGSIYSELVSPLLIVLSSIPTAAQPAVHVPTAPLHANEKSAWQP